MDLPADSILKPGELDSFTMGLEESLIGIIGEGPLSDQKHGLGSFASLGLLPFFQDRGRRQELLRTLLLLRRTRALLFGFISICFSVSQP